MEKRKVKLITPETGHTGLIAEKLGRNDKCRCKSGLKAKHCCGNATAYFSREPQKRSLVDQKLQELKRSKRAQ